MTDELFTITYADVTYDIPMTTWTISEHDCINLFRSFITAFWAFYIPLLIL